MKKPCRAGWLAVLLLGAGPTGRSADEALEELKARGRAAAGPIGRLETRFTLGLWGTPNQCFGDRYADALDDVRRHSMNFICQLGVWRSDDTTPRYLHQMRDYVEAATRLDLSFFIHCQGLLPRTDREPWDFESAVSIARQRLLPWRQAPPVLGWYLCDEAPFEEGILRRFLQLKAFLQKEAPDCASVILLSPGDNPFGPGQWSPYLNVLLTDMYGYASYTDVLCAAINRQTPRPHWVTLDAFRYVPGPMADVAWGRLKTYIALARGANGVNYYTYSGCWGLEGLGAWGLVDAYGNARDGLWEALGQMARVLEPIGHQIAPAKVVGAPIRAACRKTVRTQRAPEQPESVSPAVEIGVRRDAAADTDFIICFNNDTFQPSEAAIEIYEFYLGPRRVYDLYTLKEIPLPRQRHYTHFRIEPLPPGDGRIYAVCPEAGFEPLKRAILQRRYHNERLIAELDLAWSRATGLETAPAEAALQRAQQLAAAGDRASAEAAACEARTLLAQALQADARLAAAYGHMRQAQTALGRCDELLTYHVNSLWSAVQPSARAKDKRDPMDPRIRPWVDLTLKLSEAYRRLRYLERQGHLRRLAPAAEFLAGATASLLSGVRDMLDGNFIPARYDAAGWHALHDACDAIRPERFAQWNHAWYVPWDPRNVALGDTSSVAAVNRWFPYYRGHTFATEAEAKALDLKPLP